MLPRFASLLPALTPTAYHHQREVSSLEANALRFVVEQAALCGQVQPLAHDSLVFAVEFDADASPAELAGGLRDSAAACT